jgi:hypothetical protein
MMDAISSKDSYRLFVDALDSKGYKFVIQRDEKRRFLGYEWCDDPRNEAASGPRVSAGYFFLRRQSWLQIDLTFVIKDVQVQVSGQPGTVDVALYSGNLFQEFKVDHPKTEAGVLAAAGEVKKLLDRFKREFSELAPMPIWTGDIEIMGSPLAKWVVTSGQKPCLFERYIAPL